MKFSLIKNDKSTANDELLLFLFILACAGVGAALIIFKPAFWIITSELTMCFGIFWVIVAVMFIPGLIYRLGTNEKNCK